MAMAMAIPSSLSMAILSAYSNMAVLSAYSNMTILVLILTHLNEFVQLVRAQI